MSLSSSGFLRSGVTWANLNVKEKMPSDMDRLARCATSSEKTEEQDLMREEGMKSMRDHLKEDLLMR